MALSPTTYWRGQVDQTLLNHEDQLLEHDQKIGVLEKFVWKLMGAAVIGSLLGGVLATVTAYLIIGAVGHH